ncbi:MAG: tRNA lysidine(34) synthetase TilS [Oscillospiraceae bacterium]|nr:tRNA lysidine(34) synthetase TilS [Oscillospiraceae bacterium]
MEERVYRFIQEHALLCLGDDVTVALSGGADSVALLWVMRRLAPRLELTVRAAHFHHGIRGEEADRDADFCRSLCRDWNIPFALGRGDAPARAAQRGESLEEAARVLRYTFLRSAAPGKLATAHNGDDNVETILLHLLRGTGLRGLAGIPLTGEKLLRPLLCCTRGEIDALLEREKLPHVEDSTNGKDDCLRNRLRHRVMPLLREENPSLVRTVGRTSALLREEDAYLSRLAEKAALDCEAGEGLSSRALLELDPVLRRRVLMGSLRKLGLENPAMVYVEGLESLLRAGPSARMLLPGGLSARREYDRLLFGPLQEFPPLPDLSINVPGRTVLPDGLGQLVCFVTKSSNFSQKKPTTFALKCDMIRLHKFRVRSRLPGDKLCLPGGAKQLKALMIDRKLPAQMRAAIPVLTLDGGLIAVFGIGADPSFVASENEEAPVIRYEGPLFSNP